MCVVSSGTGSMTLPVCELGVELFGSDLSRDMLDKCALKAKAMGHEVTLVQSDFCCVAEKSTGSSISSPVRATPCPTCPTRTC